MAAERRVRVILDADVSAFNRGMDSAAKSVEGVSKAAQSSGKSTQASFTSTANSAKQVGTAGQAAGKQAAQGMDQVAQAGKRAGSSFGDFAKRAGALAAGAGLVSFAKGAIDAASDLNETLSKSAQIFGDNAAAIESWANTASTSLGLAKGDAIAAAASFGDMFSQIGFAGGQAADMSKTVVQMAADLGSFNNLDTGDVLDRISGALRGEYDSLQAVIPNISAARVANDAMAASGKTSASALTAQEKATATLAIIQKDGARAMGDFARTADGAANQQKTIAAQFKETQAAIGQALLPAFQSLLSAFQDALPIIKGIGTAVGGLVTLLTQLPTPVYAVAAAFGAWAKFGGPLTLMFKTIKQEIAFASYEMGGFAGKAKSAFAALGPGIVAAALIVKATDAIERFNTINDAAAATSKASGAAITTLAGTYDKLTGSVTDATRAQAANRLMAFDDGKLVEYAHSVGLTTKDIVDAYLGLPNARDVREKLGAYGNAPLPNGWDAFFSALTMDGGASVLAGVAQTTRISQLWGEAGQARDEYEANKRRGPAGGAVTAMEFEGRETLKAQKKAQDESLAQQKAYWGEYVKNMEHAQRVSVNEGQHNQLAGLKFGLEGVKAAADLAAGSIEMFGLAMDRLAGRNVPIEEAKQAVNDAVRAIKDFGSADNAIDWSTVINTPAAQKATGELIDTTTEAGSTVQNLANTARTGYDTVTTAAYTAALAQGDVAGAIDKGRAAADAARTAFIGQHDAMGLTSDEAAVLADRLGIVEGSKISPKTFTIGADFSDAKLAMQEIGTLQVGNKTFYVDGKTGEAYTTLKELEAARIADKNVNINATDNASGTIATVDAKTIADKTFNIKAAIQSLPPGMGGWTGGLVGPHGIGFAGGGLVPGTPPRDPTHDNVRGMAPFGPIRVQSGEMIVNGPGTRKNLAALQYANAGGKIPGFAAGGIPSNAALAGIGPRNMGARESVSAGALGDLASWVKDLGQAAKSAADDLKASVAQLADARKDANQVAHDAGGKTRTVARENAQKLADATKRLTDAQAKSTKTAADRAARDKAIHAAELARNKVIRDNTERTVAATRAENAANKAAGEKVTAAKRAEEADRRAARATATRYAGEVLAQKATADGRKLLQSLARQADETASKLGDARDKLANQRAEKASAASSIASGIRGTGGGITGGADTRNTFAQVLAGRKNDAAKVAAFEANLKNLAKKGLSADQLRQIADEGVDSAGGRAAVLAKASPAEIAQLNKVNSAIAASAKRSGDVVASKQYDAGIAATVTAVGKLETKLADTNKAIGNLAPAVGKVVADALDGRITAVTKQGLAVMVKQGNAELKRRGA